MCSAAEVPKPAWARGSNVRRQACPARTTLVGSCRAGGHLVSAQTFGPGLADPTSRMFLRSAHVPHNNSCGTSIHTNLLILLVGAGRFELPTPSPPDWCANQAALRSGTCAFSCKTPVPPRPGRFSARHRSGRDDGWPCHAMTAVPWEGLRRQRRQACGPQAKVKAGVARAALRKEIVAEHVGHQRHDLLGLIDLFPRRHTAKAVVNPIPDKLGLVGARLQLWRFTRIGSGAMAVRALVVPDLFPLRDDRRVLQDRGRDCRRRIAWRLGLRGGRRGRLSITRPANPAPKAVSSATVNTIERIRAPSSKISTAGTSVARQTKGGGLASASLDYVELAEPVNLPARSCRPCRARRRVPSRCWSGHRPRPFHPGQTPACRAACPCLRQRPFPW